MMFLLSRHLAGEPRGPPLSAGGIASSCVVAAYQSTVGSSRVSHTRPSLDGQLASTSWLLQMVLQ